MDGQAARIRSKHVIVRDGGAFARCQNRHRRPSASSSTARRFDADAAADQSLVVLGTVATVSSRVVLSSLGRPG